MKVQIEGFAGMLPAKDPKLLDSHQAQTATNTRLWTGSLEPWKGTADQAYNVTVATPTTIYHYQWNYWFEWNQDVDVVRSPIANDSYKRVYWTGDGKPKKTDHTVATGAHPYPSTEYLLEVPKPANGPTLSFQDSSDPANKEDIAYVTTYVSDYGEEGQPSDPSAVVSAYWRDHDIVAVATGSNTVTVSGDQTSSWGSGDTAAIVGSTGNDGNYTVSSASYDSGNDQTNIVTNESIGNATADGNFRTRISLSNIPDAPTGAYNMAKFRVYRYHAGTTNGEYVYVGERAIGYTTFDDSVPPALLGEVIPSAHYNTPPDDMIGLVGMANGVLAGFSGNEVCLSEPYLPHTYPSAYRQSTNYQIVGLGTFGTTLVILTEGHPYLLTGVDPASMTMEEVDLPQACVSKRGIVSTQSGVIYPSPDGLVFISSGGGQLLTQHILTRDQWQAYNPSSIHAYYYNNRYHAFWKDGASTGGIILDPQNPASTFTETDLYPTTGYTDLVNDSLFLVLSSSIEKWDAGSTNLTYRWRSKVFQAQQRVNFTCGRVFATSFDDLVFRLYADGQLGAEIRVQSDGIFRLPSGFRARDWEIELEGTDEVQRVAIASRPQEIG